MRKEKEVITVEDFKSLKKGKRLKFGNKIIRTPDGVFQSEWELKRWGELKMMRLAGMIRGLRRQVEYKLVVQYITIGKYIADFEYVDAAKGVVVEDTKSEATEALESFRMKKALMMAIYGIDVSVIMKPNNKKYNGKITGRKRRVKG